MSQAHIVAAIKPHIRRKDRSIPLGSQERHGGDYVDVKTPTPSPTLQRRPPAGLRSDSFAQANNSHATHDNGGSRIAHSRISDIAEFQLSYSTISELGEGSYGMVTKVAHRKSGVIWACKEVQKERAGSSGIAMLELEIAVLKQLNHPHVVSMHEVFETPKQTLIVMEACGGGSLEDLYVNDAGKPAFTVQQVSTIMRRVTRAIAYIHSEGIVHRDMKLENVMVKTKNKLDIKICDFGLCARDGQDTQMQQVCGTPTYMAPEVLENLGQYSPLCDIWSLGVMLYVLLTASLPFVPNAEARSVMEAIQANPLEKLLARHAVCADPGIQGVLQNLLEVAPARRMTAKELLDHPWVSTNDLMHQTTTAGMGGTGTVLEMMKAFAAELNVSQCAEITLTPDHVPTRVGRNRSSHQFGQFGSTKSRGHAGGALAKPKTPAGRAPAVATSGGMELKKSPRLLISIGGRRQSNQPPPLSPVIGRKNSPKLKSTSVKSGQPNKPPKTPGYMAGTSRAARKEQPKGKAVMQVRLPPLEKGGRRS